MASGNIARHKGSSESYFRFINLTDIYGAQCTMRIYIKWKKGGQAEIDPVIYSISEH